MIYLELFLGFLRVGLFSFGGAYAAIPLIRDVVLSYGWLTDSEFAYMIAVSESTPGPIMINLATYVGSSQAGILGSLLATFTVALPSFIIILVITAVLTNLLKNKYVNAVFRGLQSCIIGIITATGAYMVLNNCLSVASAIDGKAVVNTGSLIITIIIGAVTILSKKFSKKEISPIRLIIIGAVLGIIVFGI